MQRKTASKWVRRGAILVAATQVIETPGYNLAQLIACPECRATVIESCRSRTGKPRAPHANRLAPRLCRCGESLAPRRQLCDECRDESIRVSKRDYLRRVRQAA